MEEFDLLLESLLNPKRLPKFPLSLHHSEGIKHFQLKKYDEALKHLDIAHDIDPDNYKVLVNRCKVFLNMRQFENALGDAKKVLSIEPSCVEGIDLKGKTEYQMGDFEAGYKTYAEGLEMRPTNNLLRIGRQLCEEAMNNSMRKETKIKIDSHDVHDLRDAGHRKFVPGFREKVPFRQDFLTDKKFLKNLLADSAATDVHTLCQEAVSFISKNQRFRAMQNPCKRKPKVDKFQIRHGRKGPSLQHIASLISRCRFFRKMGLTASCISECEKLLKIVENCPDISKTEQWNIKTDVIHLLGSSYKLEKNSLLHIQYLQWELQYSQKHDLLIGYIRASHSLAEYYKKCENIPEFYKYFHLLNKKLKSDRFRAFWENRNEFLLYDMKIDEMRTESLNQVKQAIDWARTIEKNLKDYLKKDIIEPALEITQDKNQKQFSHLNLNIESVPKLLSDSSASEDFYPFDSESDSNSSRKSD